MPRPVPPALGAIAALLLPPLRTLVGRRWSGTRNLPRSGGFVVAANHVSNLDPVLVGDLLLTHGAPPAILAKSELFARPVLAAILRAAGQVEVRRDSADAARALDDARAALRSGRCVLVFPEGSFTRDPDLWPMTGRTGAARLALEAGVPLVPVVTWGGQRVLPPFTSRFRPWPRVTAEVVVGRPMTREDLLPDAPAAPEAAPGAGPTPGATPGADLTADELAGATARIMDRLAAMLGVVRGETPPLRLWDTRVDGDPHPRRRRGR
ncbi:lysophospholipid acyltransferase family protein [Georgenia sp. Z1491]|uniref:lysophospholipid acyltransferase family protein n=1 Tax=Georgenia sp. Z1491 TaxID=3416707 RepID=UPI003CE7B398